VHYKFLTWYDIWLSAGFPHHNTQTKDRLAICISPHCTRPHLLLLAQDTGYTKQTYGHDYETDRQIQLILYTFHYDIASILVIIHTHTHLFNGPFFRDYPVSRYQKGKTNLDFTEARDSKWQWHQLGHMEVCNSLQTDNHATSRNSVFYTPDALPAAKPTASKHWRQHTSDYNVANILVRGHHR